MSRKFLIVFGTIIIVGITLFSPPAFAREDHFIPAIGEVFADSVGLEKAVVTAEGGLNLYSAQNKVLSGFPVFLANQVFLSSPILGNVIGDDENEIIVISRNGDNFSLNVYSGDGNVVGATALNIGEIYFDPIALPRPGSDFVDIVIAGVNGSVNRYRFENNVFVQTLIANTQTSVGLAVNADKNLLILNFPERNGISIYNWNNDNLVLQRNLAIAQRIIYPVKDAGDGVWYGINNIGEMFGFNPATGSLAPGFPINNPSMPISSPEIINYNEANLGDEIVVTLSNGKMNVVSKAGVILEEIKQKQSFVDSSLPTKNETNNGILWAIRNYGIKVANRLTNSLGSIFSRIIKVVIPENPNIEVKIAGDLIRSGGEYDLGTYDTNEQINFQIRIENSGNGILNLIGNIPVELIGDASNYCQIPNQPAVNISGHGFREVAVSCQYNIVGDQTIQIQIANNVANQNPYLISLKLKTVPNKVSDGTMEENGIDKWLKYGAAINFEKSTDVFKNGQRSMRLTLPGTTTGMHQRRIPVEAGKIYRLSFNYLLNSGQLKTWMGINTCNSDFERRVSVINNIGQWNYYSREFKVPDNFLPASDFRLMFSIANGEVFVDDVRIQEIANFTVVSDGDMEYRDVDRWTKYGLANIFEKSTAVYKNGQRSMRVGAPIGGGFQQRFLAVSAGKNYRLTFDYLILKGKLISRLGNNDSNADFENKTANLTNKDGWQSYTREFKMPDNFVGDFRLVFNTNKNTDASSEVFVDDVAIEEIQTLPLITDGNMEAVGAGAWADWGNFVILKEKDSIEKHSGNYSLKIRTGTLDGAQVGGVQQIGINNLVPGGNYIFSCWYKNTAGTFTPRLGIKNSNADFQLLPAQWPFFKAPSDGWQYYERSFTVPADFTGDLRLVFVMYDQDWAPDEQSFTDLDYAEAYVDDVEIRRVQ